MRGALCARANTRRGHDATVYVPFLAPFPYSSIGEWTSIPRLVLPLPTWTGS